MESSAGDDISLQPTVLAVLSRLQSKQLRKKPERTRGVSCKTIVQFIKRHVPWVDGDVESQVLTVLLTCVKTGLICVQENGKYRLVEMNSKNMISSCETRVSHGPKCCCLEKLKKSFKSFRRPCCVYKGNEYCVQRGLKKTDAREKKKKNERKKKPSVKCIQSAQQDIRTSKSNEVLRKLKKQKKCKDCLAIHTPKLEKTRKRCARCYPSVPSVSAFSTSHYSFSPRDEHKCDAGSGGLKI